MDRRTYLAVSAGLLAGGTGLISASRLLNKGWRSPLHRWDAAHAPPTEAKVRWAAAYGRLPLHFEVNLGQTDPHVKFLARGPGHTLFLTAREAVLVLAEPRPITQSELEQGAVPATQCVLRMSFVAASRQARVAGLEESPGKANSFIGNDPTRWRTNVPQYAKVRYRNIYRGIDLFFSGTQRQLAFAFVVGPGADPKRIVFGWQGADAWEVDAEGDLVLHTARGMLRQRKPVIYQQLGGTRQGIPGGYVQQGADHVAFALAAYDARRPLVISGSADLSISTDEVTP